MFRSMCVHLKLFARSALTRLLCTNFTPLTFLRRNHLRQLRVPFTAICKRELLFLEAAVSCSFPMLFNSLPLLSAGVCAWPSKVDDSPRVESTEVCPCRHSMLSSLTDTASRPQPVQNRS